MEDTEEDAVENAVEDIVVDAKKDVVENVVKEVNHAFSPIESASSFNQTPSSSEV